MPTTKATPGTFGERLKLARKRGSFTASGLSTAAGLSQALVGMIERGDAGNPSVETAEKLANTLGVSIEWLITGEGEMFPRRRARAGGA